MATYTIDQLKQAQDFKRGLAQLQNRNLQVRRQQDDSGNLTGYKLVEIINDDTQNDLGTIPSSLVNRVETGSGDNHQVQYKLDKEKYFQEKMGFKPPPVEYSKMLKTALDDGVDLRPLYGNTYQDALQFKRDLGQYRDKDSSLVLPANPVGYQGGFKFDPNFGTEYYRQLATAAGNALGLSPEQINQSAKESIHDALFSGDVKATIGFNDLGKPLLDKLAGTAGIQPSQLQQFYDVNTQIYNGLNEASKVESQTSGVLKKFSTGLDELPGLVSAGLNYASGGLYGIGKSLARGDFLGAGLQYGMGELTKAATTGGFKGVADRIGQIPSDIKGLFDNVRGGFNNLFGDVPDLAGASSFTNSGVVQPNTLNPQYSLAEGYNPSLGLDAGAQGITGLTPPTGFDINPNLGTSFVDAAYKGSTSSGFPIKPLLGLGGGLALLSNTGFGQNLIRPRNSGGAQPTYGTPTDGVVNPNDPNAVGAYTGPAYQGYTGPNYGNLNTTAMQRPTKRSFNQGGIASLGRMVNGAGDGMSDNINATIDGQEPINIADGEYIIPAQAVSALGNGSSNAGAKVLDDMVERVYEEQTGKPKQMKKLPIGRVLPV